MKITRNRESCKWREVLVDFMLQTSVTGRMMKLSKMTKSEEEGDVAGKMRGIVFAAGRWFGRGWGEDTVRITKKFVPT